MALSKPVTDLKLFLCPLCTETLILPKILPCLHTFCEKCILEHITNVELKTKNKLTEFSCPICRTAVKRDEQELESGWASSLQTNNSLTAMMATVLEGKERGCDACKEHYIVKVAKFWCKDCMETMCDDCMAKHNWIKILRSHTITNLSEMETGTHGLDLSVLPEKCSTHSSEKVDSFCFDHNRVSCIACLTTDHRSCKLVKPLKDTTESIHIQTKLDTLTKMINEAKQLLKAKEDELENFQTCTTSTEDEAVKFVKTLKCRLDQLFETFTKQLRIYHDDHKTELEVCVRLLKQLIENLSHWLTTIDVISKFGTRTQLLIHIETVEKHVFSCIMEMQEAIRNCKSVNIAFQKDGTLQEAEAVDQIGTFSIKEVSMTNQMNQIVNVGAIFGIKVEPNFQTMKVEKVKTLHIPGSEFECGVSIDETHIILGDYIESQGSNLHLMNIEVETIISSVQFDGNVKSLCYDSRHNHVFISCHGGRLFRAPVLRSVLQIPEKLEFNKTIYFLGGLQCSHDRVYIITEGEICLFPITIDTDRSVESVMF